MLHQASAPRQNEQLAELAHELRNMLGAAVFAMHAIKTGGVGISGAMGAVLDRSLNGMRDLIDRSLADVRVAGVPPSRLVDLNLGDFIDDIRVVMVSDARAKGVDLVVERIDPVLVVRADSYSLSSAVVNVLQNAIKFTGGHHGRRVVVRTQATPDRVRIDVEDQCGGLPLGKTEEELFRPFVQCGSDRSGVGLGLSISRKAVEAGGGTIVVRDRPGVGCVFTIDVPRHVVRSVVQSRGLRLVVQDHG